MDSKKPLHRLAVQHRKPALHDDQLSARFNM
jgi:hypothetical protein